MAIDVLNLLRPPKVMSLLSDDIIGAVNMARYNNNARMIRAGVVPVICLISLAALWLGQRRGMDLQSRRFRVFYARFAGSLMGLCLLWENCMGVAHYFVFSFLWLLVMIKYERRDLRALASIVGQYIACGVACFFAFLALITHGDVGSWFTVNLSIAADMPWYYINGPKILHLRDITFDLWIIAGVALLALFLAKMLRARTCKATVRYLLLSTILLGGLAANYFYAWSSGGKREDNIILAILFITVAWACRLLSSLTIPANRRLAAQGLSLFACLGGAMLFYNIAKNDRMAGRTYIPEMGGTVAPAVAEDLRIGQKTLGQDATLFSTYATAAEVLAGQYQPSGFDYLINAIGPANQQKYMESFRASAPDFVQTIHSEYSKFQIWERDQDWFFYRELYGGYAPYTMNSYATFWRKNDAPAPAFTPEVRVEVLQKSGHIWQITASSPTRTPFVLDLTVAYHTEYPQPFLRTGLVRNMVMLSDLTNPDRARVAKLDSTTNYIYMPASGERQIPLSVVNGYGSVTLSSLAGEDAALTVDSAVPGAAFETPYRYLHCLHLSDDNWTEGVAIRSGMLLLSLDDANKACLTDAVALKNHQGDVVPIDSIEEVDGGYLHIRLADDAHKDTFAYPDLFEVVRAGDADAPAA